jgi:hypothetical protein
MKVLAAFSVLLLGAACQAPSTEMSEADREQIVTEAESYLEEYEEAWEALDIDWAQSLVVQSPEYTWAWDGSITRGFETLDQLARSTYSSLESYSLTPSDRHFAVLSRDAVAVLDVGTVIRTLPGGDTSESTYTYSYVLVRRDGVWKMLVGHGALVNN